MWLKKIRDQRAKKRQWRRTKEEGKQKRKEGKKAKKASAGENGQGLNQAAMNTFTWDRAAELMTRW